jgi:hypothetical protein
MPLDLSASAGAPDAAMRVTRPASRDRVVIGVDFDNTLATYDHVFLAAARQRGLLVGPTDAVIGKKAIRDALRRRLGGETAWQELQGFVYGRGIVQARMAGGADHFLRRCREVGHKVLIVSHKTRYSHHDPTRTDLRRAALDWLAVHGFFGADQYGIGQAGAYFRAGLHAFH